MKFFFNNFFLFFFLNDTQVRFGSVSTVAFYVFTRFQFSFFLLQPHLLTKLAANSALAHCSQVPQITLFSNFFIKNGSHDIIHTFKNYFVIVFSVFSFSKISSIQTNPHTHSQVTPGKEREKNVDGGKLFLPASITLTLSLPITNFFHITHIL